MSTDNVPVTPGAGKNVAGYGFTEDAITKIAQRIALNAQDGTDIMGLLTNPAWTTGDPASLVALWRAIRVAVDAVTAAVGTGTVGTGVPGTPNLTTLLSIQGAAGMTALAGYPLPPSPVSGFTVSMTDTATHAVTGVGAPASGKFNWITGVAISNSHATVGTEVELQDGSGGTSFAFFPAAPAFSGAMLALPTPLKQPTAATALFARNTTTGAAVRLTAIGFQA